jgi:hypothetical protein
MQLKVQDVIVDAMNLIGVIAISETPSAAEMQIGIRTLNMMLDHWSANRLMLRSTDTTSFPLVSGKGVYTIGPATCDIIAPKPIKIERAFMRDSNGIDYLISVVPQSEYDSYRDKSIITALPATIYYDPGTAQQSLVQGTINVYPMPDANGSYTMFIDYDAYLSEFSSLTTVITFDPAYYEALVYGLALRLFRRYHVDPNKQVPTDISAAAAAAIKTIENMNSVQARASMDVPGKVTTFNVYTGDYN